VGHIFLANGDSYLPQRLAVEKSGETVGSGCNAMKMDHKEYNLQASAS